jgi:RimJ/RimL family protein N-acetyltransferase
MRPQPLSAPGVTKLCYGSCMLDPLPRVGSRVILRRLRPADLPAFQAYRNDEVAGRYQGWSAQTDPQALAFIEEMSRVVLFPKGTWVQLAVADRATDGLIGDIGVCVATDGMSAELGFTISPNFHGQGLGTEAVREAISLVFDHSSVNQVVCITDARNIPAVRLLERTGMRRVATADNVFRGERCVEHTYAANKDDGGSDRPV